MHHYLPLDPSVHEEGSKVGGPLDHTIGSHFGSTLSEFKTLSNSHYTLLPLPYYKTLLGLCDFQNFHISQLPQYTSSVVHGSRREARLRDTGPPHTNRLSVDLFKIQNPFKSILRTLPSFLFCILSTFDNFQNFHKSTPIRNPPTL